MKIETPPSRPSADRLTPIETILLVLVVVVCVLPTFAALKGRHGSQPAGEPALTAVRDVR